jgi:prevent-host-death family protein
MTTVNVHEAKTHFSRLLERVHAGEDIVIAKAGRPIARLVPYRQTQGKRKLGLMAGQFTVPEDFDRMGADEIHALFAGEPPAAPTR